MRAEMPGDDPDLTDVPGVLPDGLRPRARRVAPFLAALAAALAVAALPPQHLDQLPLLGTAAVGLAACAAVTLLVRWDRLPVVAHLGVVAVFCASVGLLREATGGATSGFAVILLLAVAWQAAYGRRVDLAGTVALVAATIAVPAAVWGAPDYPSTEWRKAAVMALVAAVLGAVVRRLVYEVRQERGLVRTVAHLARSMASGEDPRGYICDATLELTGADLVILFEPVAEGLQVSHSAGIDLPRTVVPPQYLTANLRDAVATGEARTTLDATKDAASTAEVYQAFGMRSWMHQPASRAGTTAVVLTVGWAEPRRRLVPTRAREALPLLAAEAAAAIDRADLVDRLAELARQDPLTGLMNRRAWDDHLEREVARMRRTGRPLSVAVIDLDHFKAFNDHYGHLVGDQLLKSAAGAWTSALRTSDVLARWGGEEFAILMPDTPAEEALRILSRLSARTPMGQTLSGGFVTTSDEVQAERLMAGADVAVYSAKAAGRNRIHRGEVAPDPTGTPVEAG